MRSDKTPGRGERTFVGEMIDGAVLSEDLQRFAERLASFAPCPAGVSRDALMFAAGQAAGARATETGVRFPPYRAWQCATASLAVVSLSLGTALIGRPAAVPRVVVVERPVESPRPVPAVRPDVAPVAPPVAIAAASSPVESSQDDSFQQVGPWVVRQALITYGNGQESCLAAISSGRGDVAPAADHPVDMPLSPTALIGEQSRRAISRWLEEQL